MMGNINYAEETIDQKPKETQLLYAAANGRIHRLRALLAEGNFGDVDPPNSRAFTPLFLAAKQGHEDCVRALLEAGAQVDGISTNSRNLTPLWVATFAGHDACVKLLVDAGANVAAGFPRNPVHVAAQEGRANCLKLLLDARRAPIPAGGAIKRHSTPLHVACEKGNLECTQLLIQNGYALDALDTTGLTPLHYTCSNGHQACVEALLKAGAEVNLMSKNWNFQSALHICAEHSRVEIARLLLVYGANVFVRDRAGFTPRDKAKSLEMQELLQEHEGVNGIPCDSLDQEELGWQTRSTKQKSTQVIFFWARVFVFLLVLKMFSVPSTCFFLMTKLLHEYANSSFY